MRSTCRAAYFMGMGEDLRSKSLLWLAVLTILALIAAPWILRLRQERSLQGMETPAPRLSTLIPAAAPAHETATGGGGGEGTSDVTPPSDAASAPRPHPVDLSHLRERLPDNLYWRMGAPTTDPEELRQREQEERSWNTLYGKVLSNTASEAEIHAYYAHRRQVSEDFMAFAALVLEEYGPRLPETERGLYELSIRMHHTRLEELPQRIDEALARKHVQERRRESWRRSAPSGLE
ncbi:hypothetical protein [Melittangium boletus]|uniref:hypothetical protein n=1 Tax=Melittangium boletus TaxID=83453 RepID=UPI003DA5E547